MSMFLPRRPSIPALGLAATLLATPPAGAQEEEPPDPLPPPLVAPVIVPPGEGLRLAPLAAPTITFAERVLEIVNQERAANGGLPPLKGVAELFTSSGTHSFNMADRNFFDHCDPDDDTWPWDRMFLFGYDWRAAAENIAAGYSTPEDAMAGWMVSTGHRANILSTSYREIGVGFVEVGSDDGSIRTAIWDETPDDGVQDCVAHGSMSGPLYRYWTQNLGSRTEVYPLVINRESHDTVCAELDLYVYGETPFLGERGPTQMRFSDDGVVWTAWETFAPNATWDLAPAASSPVTIFAQVRSGSTIFPAEQDEITLGSGFPAASTLAVPQQTVSTSESFEACDTVSATAGFEVTATGDVTFHAGRLIVLGDGFSVASGGSFRAVVDSTL